MPITTVPLFALPPEMPEGQGILTNSNFGSINASGDRVGFVIRVPKTGTLHSFEVNVAIVTNNPDNGIRLSFQDVSLTTGVPDTTQDQYRDFTGTAGTISTGWTTPTGPLTSDGTDNGTKRSVTKGDLLACVIDFVNFVASDAISIRMGPNIGQVSDRSFYPVDGSGGTWAKTTTATSLCLVLKYDDGSYADIGSWSGPYVTVADTSFASDTTPDERGIRFTAPVGMRATGAWIRTDPLGDFQVKLYNTSNTELATSPTYDKDTFTNSGSGGINIRVYFTSTVELQANMEYRLTLLPTTTTALTLAQTTLPSAAHNAAFPAGSSTSFILTTRTNGGTFSDTDTTRPFMGLLIDGIDASAGSGGGNSGGAVYILME